MKISGDSVTKKNGKKGVHRSSITVVVLGDEGVGKSSLISSFVSRHFSEDVPGIMTRVRLPPEKHCNAFDGCITTIIDTRNGDEAMIKAVEGTTSSSESPTPTISSLSMSEVGTRPLHTTGSSLSGSSSVGGRTSPGGRLGSLGMENVDVIILVYDLENAESFLRLESHWLPLAEQCYGGEIPVIIAGNKLDLIQPISPTQSQARSRHQIVSLLQRFKFVRQCIKCSAKTLLNVNEIFQKSQHAVLYPISPIYDLTQGKLTAKAIRAFKRIFRLFDLDCDGLLSLEELNAFQNKCFKSPLVEGDLVGWKKALMRNGGDNESDRDTIDECDQPLIVEGKFSITGFLAIFDVFINSDKAEIPWKILRNYGYGEDLSLGIPQDIINIGSSASWKLDLGSSRFLENLFCQFDRNNDGLLEDEDIGEIFSIISDKPNLPPWHPLRAERIFKDCFSSPKVNISLQTKDLPPPSTQPMTFMNWMSHWYMISSISPTATQAELYRLGYTRSTRKRPSYAKQLTPYTKRKIALTTQSSMNTNSIPLRILFIGTLHSGNMSLLNYLLQIQGSVKTEKKQPESSRGSNRPETMCTHVTVKRKTTNAKSSPSHDVHLIFTDIPEGMAMMNDKDTDQSLSLQIKNGEYNLVLFGFDSTSMLSLEYVLEMEERILTEDMPRTFIGFEKQQNSNDNTHHKDEDENDKNNQVKNQAANHCARLDLEPPVYVPIGITENLSNTALREHVLEQISRCGLVEDEDLRLRSKPHAEKKRREAATRRKLMWLGGLVTVSVAVVVSVGMLLGGGNKKGGGVQSSSSANSSLGWFRSWWNGGGRATA